jgi:hypothetical protein
MEKTALFELTARLRRAFPRVLDVLLICDEAERLANARAVPERVKPKRDRAAYMRNWRAKRRTD